MKLLTVLASLVAFSSAVIVPVALTWYWALFGLDHQIGVAWGVTAFILGVVAVVTLVVIVVTEEVPDEAE